MNNLYQKGRARRLETVIIAFFVLALLFALAVYLIDPSIYTKTLLLEPSSADRYPYPATLFLVCLFVFIAILSVGVMRHWRWLFWLLLVAFGFSILQVPVTILQLTGIFPDPTPLWYSLLRMGIAMIEIGIAVWMIQIYRHHGVWAMGKKKKTSLQ
jgi:hypothetical protein